LYSTERWLADYVEDNFRNQERAAVGCIGRTKAGLSSRLHAVCDGEGRSIVMMLTERQIRDHKGAFLLFNALTNAKKLLGDNGYDSDWFRAELTARGITMCIPPKANRKAQYRYDKTTYKKRHLVENLFAKIKDC
jgi:transposase